MLTQGFVSLCSRHASQLQSGLESELGDGRLGEGVPHDLPAHAHAAIAARFDAVAIGDVAFPQPYIDGSRFNVIFAEALFSRCDADADGRLTYTEAQRALQFLTRPPVDGAPKPTSRPR